MVPISDSLLPFSLTLNEPLQGMFQEFCDCFLQLCKAKGIDDSRAHQTILELYHAIKEQIESPFLFSSMHHPTVEEERFYQLGLAITAPLIQGTPTIHHPELLKEIQEKLLLGENIIFAANHQTELEPQILSIACDPIVPDLFRNTYFVAGERVTTDPMAAPLSRGRQLFCIYAKRYVAENSQVEIERRMHNLKTIKQMKGRLNAGGCAIYVALGGGRDRPDKKQQVQLTPFDPSSVGLFTLLATTAKKNTTIYPLVVSTFNVLPPPFTIRKELGERRWTQGGSVEIAFGSPFDPVPFLQIEDKERMHKTLTQKLFHELERLYTPYTGNVAPQ